jgi:long-chain fatty acid transport protein
MKLTQRLAGIVLLAAMGWPITAMGGGIELAEQSAPAMGRVLAVKAWLDDPSTTFYNPAGLAYLKGFHLSVGDTMVLPFFNYSDARNVPDEEKHPDSGTIRAIVPPPHAYLSYAVPLGGEHRLGFGASFNYPFGLTVAWKDNFAGRHLTSESGLLIPEITLAVAYSPMKQLSFGAGFVMSPAHVYLKRMMGPSFGLVTDDGTPISDAFVEMSGDGWGFGFSAGVQVRPVENLFLGLVFRSAIDIQMAGDASFEIPGLSDKSAFPDQTVETAFQLPDIVSLGVGYRILPKWYSEIDFEWTFWRRFQDIPLTFPEDKTGSLSQSLPQNWSDAFVLRWGNEVAVTDAFTLRAGCGFDENPISDQYLSPMLPDSHRIFTAVGAGYRFPFGLTLDATYQFTYFLERTVTGEPCAPGSSNPQCLDSQGQYQPFGADGQASWIGNRFPATYRNYSMLLALTAKVSF